MLHWASSLLFLTLSFLIYGNGNNYTYTFFVRLLSALNDLISVLYVSET